MLFTFDTPYYICWCRASHCFIADSARWAMRSTRCFARSLLFLTLLMSLLCYFCARLFILPAAFTLFFAAIYAMLIFFDIRYYCLRLMFSTMPYLSTVLCYAMFAFIDVMPLPAPRYYALFCLLSPLLPPDACLLMPCFIYCFYCWAFDAFWYYAPCYVMPACWRMPDAIYLIIAIPDAVILLLPARCVTLLCCHSSCCHGVRFDVHMPWYLRYATPPCRYTAHMRVTIRLLFLSSMPLLRHIHIFAWCLQIFFSFYMFMPAFDAGDVVPYACRRYMMLPLIIMLPMIICCQRHCLSRAYAFICAHDCRWAAMLIIHAYLSTMAFILRLYAEETAMRLMLCDARWRCLFTRNARHAPICRFVDAPYWCSVFRLLLTQPDVYCLLLLCLISRTMLMRHYFSARMSAHVYYATPACATYARFIDDAHVCLRCYASAIMRRVSLQRLLISPLPCCRDMMLCLKSSLFFFFAHAMICAYLQEAFVSYYLRAILFLMRAGRVTPMPQRVLLPAAEMLIIICHTMPHAWRYSLKEERALRTPWCLIIFFSCWCCWCFMPMIRHAIIIAVLSCSFRYVAYIRCFHADMPYYAMLSAVVMLMPADFDACCLLFILLMLYAVVAPPWC